MSILLHAAGALSCIGFCKCSGWFWLDSEGEFKRGGQSSSDVGFCDERVVRGRAGERIFSNRAYLGEYGMLEAETSVDVEEMETLAGLDARRWHGELGARSLDPVWFTSV